MTTDFRALCAELADSVELLLEMRAVDAKPMVITEDRLSRARAALAEGDGVEVTDGTVPTYLFTLAMKALREARNPVAGGCLNRPEIDLPKLCAELKAALQNRSILTHDEMNLVFRARAALAEGAGAGPTDEELLAAQDQGVASFPPLHPEAQDLSAVEYARELEVRKARAVLSRYGTTHPRPIPVAERPWEREGFCDEKVRRWWGRPSDELCNSDWHLATRAEVVEFCADCLPLVCLPAAAIPLPEASP